MTQEKIILPEDAEQLIEQVNIDVWKVSDKKYFLTKESAIDHVITNKKCECGNLMNKYNSKCYNCLNVDRKEENEKKYIRKPFQEWDGETPLCLYNDDKFFFSEDEVFDYLVENNLTQGEIQLCICSPNNPPQIDYYVFCEDIMPENVDDIRDLAPEIMKKIDELNEFIKTQKPISWTEGLFRTELKS